MEQTLPKCEHSVYLQDSEAVRTGVAHYCSICRPSFCTDHLENAAAIQEGFTIPQVKADIPGACPECGSITHFAKGRKWECSDCHKVFKAPRYLANITTPVHMIFI